MSPLLRYHVRNHSRFQYVPRVLAILNFSHWQFLTNVEVNIFMCIVHLMCVFHYFRIFSSFIVCISIGVKDYGPGGWGTLNAGGALVHCTTYCYATGRTDGRRRRRRLLCSSVFGVVRNFLVGETSWGEMSKRQRGSCPQPPQKGASTRFMKKCK